MKEKLYKVLIPAFLVSLGMFILTTLDSCDDNSSPGSPNNGDTFVNVWHDDLYPIL